MELANFKKYLVITEIPLPSVGEQYLSFAWKTAYLGKYETRAVLEKVIESKNGYIPKREDKLFFFEGCNVPRYKVRDWGKKNNITVTIKPENATALFMRKNTIHEYLNDLYFVKLNKSALVKWLKANYNITHGNIPVLIKKIEADPNDIIYLGGNMSRYPGRFIRGYRDQYIDKSIKINLSNFDINANDVVNMFEIHDDKWKTFSELLSNPNVYSQESLIQYINEDAAVITPEYYGELRVMLNSTQFRDNVLALEIMASCNIEKSMHYVLLLIQEFGSSKISNMKESKHVNFKSLLDYLEIGSYLYVNDDGILERLMKHELLTYEILNQTALGIKEQWINSQDGQSKFFKISKIEATDELKAYFNKSTQKSELEVEQINMEEE